MSSSPPPSSTPNPSPRPPKKTYETPRVQVHGDVKTLTGYGVPSNVNPFASSINLFS